MKRLILSLIIWIHAISVFSQSIPSLTINVKQYDVKGDGTLETQKIQNALNYLASKGGGTLYIPKGTYFINSLAKSIGLSIPSNTRIKGDGMGKTILKRPNADNNFSRLIVTTNSTNVEFNDFTVDGNKSNQNQAYEQQHNFFLNNSSNILFTHIENKNTVGDGVYFFIGSKSAVFTNCKFNDITRVGINCTNLDGGKIMNCQFTNIVTNGIKVEKNQIGLTSPSRNISVSNCLFRSKQISDGAAGINLNGLLGDLVNTIEISKDTFKNIAYCVTGLRYVDNIKVQENVADSVKSMCRSLSYSLRIGFCSGSILVQNNKITSGFGGANFDDMAFAFFYFQNAVVINNTLSENKLSPYNRIILCIEDKNVEFSNNSITASGSLAGIIFKKCVNVKFHNNYVKLNTNKDAIELNDDPKIQFSSISVKNNVFDGSYRYTISDPASSTSKNRSNSIMDFQQNKSAGQSKGDILNIPQAFFRSRK